MNTFEPNALVAALLNQLNSQLNSQPDWQAWTATNHTMPEMAKFFNSTPAMLNPMPDAIGSLENLSGQMVKILNEFGGKIDPATITRLQQQYLENVSTLWQDMLKSKAPVLDDRRFKAPEWHNSSMHAFAAAGYLLNSNYLSELAAAVEAPKRIKQKILFAVEQLVDAACPANFLATNPEAQSKLIESKGESLTKGISNMLADMQKGRISQTDETAFEVGRNVATTEGQVIFENQLIQLIQYKPLHATVYQRPLLIVPPCINKFYILDLQPDNSIVRYALEQGHSVFLISWVNPGTSLANITWDDYVESGVIEAIHVAQSISGQDKINTFGFCVGGTLLSTSLAVLAARGEQPSASVTLLTTLLDFEDTGVLEVFVDEMQVEMRENTIGHGGLMSGRDLGSAFSSLRPNDLVWNYVQSNYLKGQQPPAFDLLFWNGDGTNLPGPMFCWYLRNTYLENNLKQAGKLVVAGEKVDLSKIDAPVFVYGSREDHIVPWPAAYASLSLLNPKKPARNRFILGASGHIAGVINPPAKMKRNYWSNGVAQKASIKNAEQWMEGAQLHAGSWWPEWSAFLAEHAGKKVKVASKLGSAKYKMIEPAPGRYVKTPC